MRPVACGLAGLIGLLATAQGTMAALAYTRRPAPATLVFAVAAFATAVALPAALWRQLPVLAAFAVSTAYYLASAMYLAVELTNRPDLLAYPLQCGPVVLCLVMATMLAAGAFGAAVFAPAQSVPDCEASEYVAQPELLVGWAEADTPRPGKAYTPHEFAAPAFSDTDSRLDKTLRNKESERTLVAPADEDASLHWLVQALMAGHGMDDAGDNWMGSRLSFAVPAPSPTLRASALVPVLRPGLLGSLLAGNNYTCCSLPFQAAHRHLGSQGTARSLTRTRFDTRSWMAPAAGEPLEFRTPVFTEKPTLQLATLEQSAHGDPLLGRSNTTGQLRVKKRKTRTASLHETALLPLTELLPAHDSVLSPPASPAQPPLVPGTASPHLFQSHPGPGAYSFPGHSDALDGLEPMPQAAAPWPQSGPGMRSVSLHEWEDRKTQYLGQRPGTTPLLLTLDPRPVLVASSSAPLLHTYRDVSHSGLRPSVHLALSGHTLFRFSTPPPPDEPPPELPIRKMIGRFKLKDPADPHRHHHSSLMATMALAALLKLASPRKSIKGIFRSLLDGKRDARPKPVLPPPPLDLWDVATAGLLDKSRVSSVPSAVIGEYDREKWRTLKDLHRVEA